MVKKQKFVLAKHFDGVPKDSDLRLEAEELPPIKDGEILLKAEYVSVDPYMRPISGTLAIGDTMPAEQIARVVESKNAAYPVGTVVTCRAGWVDYSISTGEEPDFFPGTGGALRKVEFAEGIPISQAMNSIGMVALTAYFGLLEICQPKEGETVFVNSAAGAVGSLVGQIAKIKGAKVIGCAGSEEKIKFLKDLGFDEVFNYKTENLDEALKRAAPNGIDCYFDNVGGSFSSTVWNHLNNGGRVAVCGLISQYNKPDDMDKVTAPENNILWKALTVKGHLYFAHAKKFPTAYQELHQWVKQGKLKYKDAITEGFPNMAKAFIGLFTGQHIGKAMVKA
ncbi:prostaglandin reductase 1-like [Glandiceps talaboti]